jgi:hypothetical protein
LPSPPGYARLTLPQEGAPHAGQGLQLRGHGLDGAIIEVEVDISRGLPSFTIVGLPDTAVQESCEVVEIQNRLRVVYLAPGPWINDGL